MSLANAEPALPQDASIPDAPWQSFRIRSAHRRDLPQIVSVLLSSFYPKTQATPWLYWLLRVGIQEDIKARLKTPAIQYACLVADLVEPASAQSTGKIVGTAEISQRPCES
ncbi:MAG: hypothetical protein ABG776_21790, partial [Cyanobacteria bacterium J06555_13]